MGGGCYPPRGQGLQELLFFVLLLEFFSCTQSEAMSESEDKDIPPATATATSTAAAAAAVTKTAAAAATPAAAGGDTVDLPFESVFFMGFFRLSRLVAGTAWKSVVGGGPSSSENGGGLPPAAAASGAIAAAAAADATSGGFGGKADGNQVWHGFSSFFLSILGALWPSVNPVNLPACRDDIMHHVPHICVTSIYFFSRVNMSRRMRRNRSHR